MKSQGSSWTRRARKRLIARAAAALLVSIFVGSCAAVAGDSRDDQDKFLLSVPPPECKLHIDPIQGRASLHVKQLPVQPCDSEHDGRLIWWGRNTKEPYTCWSVLGPQVNLKKQSETRRKADSEHPMDFLPVSSPTIDILENCLNTFEEQEARDKEKLTEDERIDRCFQSRGMGDKSPNMAYFTKGIYQREDVVLRTGRVTPTLRARTYRYILDASESIIVVVAKQFERGIPRRFDIRALYTSIGGSNIKTQHTKNVCGANTTFSSNPDDTPLPKKDWAYGICKHEQTFKYFRVEQTVYIPVSATSQKDDAFDTSYEHSWHQNAEVDVRIYSLKDELFGTIENGLYGKGRFKLHGGYQSQSTKSLKDCLVHEDYGRKKVYSLDFCLADLAQWEKNPKQVALFLGWDGGQPETDWITPYTASLGHDRHRPFGRVVPDKPLLTYSLGCKPDEAVDGDVVDIKMMLYRNYFYNEFGTNFYKKDGRDPEDYTVLSNVTFQVGGRVHHAPDRFTCRPVVGERPMLAPWEEQSAEGGGKSEAKTKPHTCLTR